MLSLESFRGEVASNKFLKIKNKEKKMNINPIGIIKNFLREISNVNKTEILPPDQDLIDALIEVCEWVLDVYPKSPNNAEVIEAIEVIIPKITTCPYIMYKYN